MLVAQVDPRAVLGYLDSLAVDQIPFAASKGINQVALAGQAKEQARLKQVFRLRREGWILRGIKITKFANKRELVAVIQIPEQQSLLTKFEEGNTKFPRKGGWVWKPNADVFGDKIILRSNPLNPHNLKFTSNGKRMDGNLGTFMIRGRGGTPLVMQRVGKSAPGVSQRIGSGPVRGSQGRNAAGKFTRGEVIKKRRAGGTRLLYHLVRSVKTPVRLAFVSTINTAVQQVWPEAMRKEMADAIKTAK